MLTVVEHKKPFYQHESKCVELLRGDFVYTYAIVYAASH